MKAHPIVTSSQVIEASDEYYDTVHLKWLPVPAFWVGDFVLCHTHSIRSKR